ncbi:Crp/Fnr family transcriptional regulator [Rubellimicrobium rubrum]|uniref:Crp/Fnr family transcriptional regulator n=1 Tax=Rubellimicrobium rubrum TaxID=2585369 RepID=A0A5C4MYL1_9RHOB|nr:Crp/Fnr family transcriptional regulator [Rubellimicrobium rubrum]TNC49590.1 Crp/Fnr family transcriptional regulator [Rubellimicrobium rubrum]
MAWVGQAAQARRVVDGAAPANRLLAGLREQDFALLAPHLTPVALGRGQVVFKEGDDVSFCHFPCEGTMISLVVALPDGALAETATVGCEGAIGGIVSLGHKPAFARAVVQIGGSALRIASEQLEELKSHSPTLRDAFARYADCMIAQVLQSVACNVLHSLEPRFCRWLLTAQDRVGQRQIPLTQESLAEMLGVQRSTVNGAAISLQSRGLISYSRGRITVIDRAALEATACACHNAVVEHFERVLPGVYPVWTGYEA